MQLVDYLNGMWYMICLPSLLCGLAISVEDIRSRRIPRAWIATGCTAQIIVNLIYALSINTLYLALQAILFAVLSGRTAMRARFGETWFIGFWRCHRHLADGIGSRLFGLIRRGVLVACDWCGRLVMARFVDTFRSAEHTAYAGKTPFAPALVAAGAIGIAIGVLF